MTKVLLDLCKLFTNILIWACIHVQLEDAIAIGCSALDCAKESMVDFEYPSIDSFEKRKYGLQEMMGYYEYDDEGNRFERTFIKRFFDEVAVSVKENELFSILVEKRKDTGGKSFIILYNAYRKPKIEACDPNDKIRNKLKDFNFLLSCCPRGSINYEVIIIQKEEWLKSLKLEEDKILDDDKE